MSRQGSASYTIVIGSMAALIVGGIMLTFVIYPITNSFRNAAFWSTQTAAGARVTTYVGGLWAAWGLVIMIAILAYIWIRTRQ